MQETIDKPIKWLKELSKNHIITPDRIFLFVIKPKDALARIKHRDELIPFEKIDFLKKVHKNYLVLARGNRFLKLDATKKIDELVKICIDDILK